MRRSRFSAEQIVRFVQEHDAGGGTAEICRRAGVTPQTLYRWKAKYGGLQVGDATRLRALEDENTRLKRLVAEQALDNQVLKDLLRKNS
jgi:putative transposase